MNILTCDLAHEGERALYNAMRRFRDFGRSADAREALEAHGMLAMLPGSERYNMFDIAIVRTVGYFTAPGKALWESSFSLMDVLDKLESAEDTDTQIELQEDVVNILLNRDRMEFLLTSVGNPDTYRSYEVDNALAVFDEGVHRELPRIKRLLPPEIRDAHVAWADTKHQSKFWWWGSDLPEKLSSRE